MEAEWSCYKVKVEWNYFKVLVGELSQEICCICSAVFED